LLKRKHLSEIGRKLNRKEGGLEGDRSILSTRKRLPLGPCTTLQISSGKMPEKKESPRIAIFRKGEGSGRKENGGDLGGNCLGQTPLDD